jgi:hypothetical protein
MSTNNAPLQSADAVLFQDFVLANEQTEYAQTRATLMTELTPQGILEQTFADEIMGANWRLRRCRIDEAGLANRISESDNNSDEDRLDQKRKSIERARSAAQLALRRCTAELRKLQTEREMRLELDMTDCVGLADSAQVLRASRMAAKESAEAPKPAAPPQPRRITMADLENLMSQADKQLCAQVRADHPSSFCKTPGPDQLPTAEERAATRRETLELLRRARNRAA